MPSRSRYRLIPVTLALLLVVGGVIPAAAAPSTEVSGTFRTTSATVLNVRVAGGNTIIDLRTTIEYTGTFEGTSVVEGHLIFHANGSANAHDVETFTGTVNGVPGTVTWNLTAGGTLPEYFGTQAITHATGDLAGLHGVLRQVGQVDDTAAGPYGTYTGQIHWEVP